MAHVTILNNAANQVADSINTKVVVKLILRRMELTKKVIDLKKEKAQMKLEVMTLKIESCFFKKQYDLS